MGKDDSWKRSTLMANVLVEFILLVTNPQSQRSQREKLQQQNIGIKFSKDQVPYLLKNTQK